MFIGAHTAVVSRAEDTFGRVTSSFIHPYGIFSLFAGRGGDWGTFSKHIFPFGCKVYAGTYILFPGLHVQRVCICHDIVIVEILIGQSAEAMAEFMYDYRAEHRMMGSGQGVGVVYATTTVFFGVGKDNDMLVRYSG